MTLPSCYECTAILRRLYLDQVEGSFDAKPQDEPYASHAFAAHFVGVAVDPDIPVVRVRRVVSAFAGGRILNARTARSQGLGGIVWGIGMALLEQTHLDKKLGSFTNVNFGEYLVPVNPDIRDLEVILVEEEDPHVNPIGVKGIGEVSMVGVAAAIGKRSLPRDRKTGAGATDHGGEANVRGRTGSVKPNEASWASSGP